MKQTPNYDLTQWEKEDRIQMEKFNEDNAAVDAAQKANADAVTLCGNCQVEVHTYQGTGNNGSVAIQFAKTPQLIVLCGTDSAYAIYKPGAANMLATCGTNNASFSVSWAENTLSWSPNGYANRLNSNGKEYTALAFS